MHLYLNLGSNFSWIVIYNLLMKYNQNNKSPQKNKNQ